MREIGTENPLVVTVPLKHRAASPEQPALAVTPPESFASDGTLPLDEQAAHARAKPKLARSSTC